MTAIDAAKDADKPPEQIRLDGYICCGGTLETAAPHLKSKIKVLNDSIAIKQRRYAIDHKYAMWQGTGVGGGVVCDSINCILYSDAFRSPFRRERIYLDA